MHIEYTIISPPPHSHRVHSQFSSTRARTALLQVSNRDAEMRWARFEDTCWYRWLGGEQWKNCHNYSIVVIP